MTFTNLKVKLDLSILCGVTSAYPWRLQSLIERGELKVFPQPPRYLIIPPHWVSFNGTVLKTHNENERFRNKFKEPDEAVNPELLVKEWQKVNGVVGSVPFISSWDVLNSC